MEPQFNVYAYADEETEKTSLLEGSIKISNKILKPGQAFVNEQIISTNTEKDVAWKNGLFSFKQDDIRRIMKQVARWYDVEVVYEYQPADTYSGKFSRKSNLNTIMEILEKSGLHFKMEQKKIIITK